MRRNKENYLKNLIHYLSDFRTTFSVSFKELTDIKEYCFERFNKDSATDSTCLLKINNLCDKFSYIEKYVDVILDFYKDKQDATK